MSTALVLMVNAMFVIPLAAMVAELVKTKRLKRDCTYPIKAKIKEIKLRSDESTSYEPRNRNRIHTLIY